MARRKVQDLELAKKLISLSNSATSRGISFSMSLRKLRQLLAAETCYYTGIKFVKGNPDLERSMDRVDSKGGYSDNNVVPCIARINTLKANLSFEELAAIVDGMRRHNKKIGNALNKPPKTKSKKTSETQPITQTNTTS